MTNTNQGSGTAAEAAVPMSHGLWNTWRKNLLLFCLTGVYVELCLHLCVFGSMDRYAGYPVLFGLLGGALCTLVVSSLPKVLRQITGVFLVAAQVLLAEVQLVYHCIFGDFMPVSQIGMGGNVVVNFNSQLLYGIRQNLLKILLLLLPLIAVILCLALRRGQALKLRLRWKQTMASFAVLLALLLTVTGLMYVGRDNAFSVYRTFTNVNTSTDSSYKKIGMLATTVQELRYMLFSGSGSIMITPSSLNISDVPRTYSSNSYNVIESIDFTALADSTDSDILKATDEYLSNATPTRKNNYTGLLKDYNLITICAESFCPWFISEELTPTLYKLSHTGILFENYYGTFQSVTTNGEYTMCMGLYPDMSRTKTDSSFNVAGTNYLPFCLGNALKGMGYQAWGYHDYIGDFYNRNITHANMGYTFKAADSGLAMKIDWPSSDLEMMEASVDDYINSGEPFHAYYMTFSGHYQYNWDNAMSAKNRDAVKDLPYSEPVKAYIACNLELEYALEYLMQRLEEAGVADKTCIVLTNDHYPYGLTEDEYNELAGQTLDTTFEKYRNSFICYVPGLSENIVVDEYCSTADILPTLLNLFGVDYDSRLLAGTDVLSSGLHVAVLSDKSFLTKTFRYDAGTETVIPPTRIPQSPTSWRKPTGSMWTAGSSSPATFSTAITTPTSFPKSPAAGALRTRWYSRTSRAFSIRPASSICTARAMWSRKRRTPSAARPRQGWASSSMCSTASRVVRKRTTPPFRLTTRTRNSTRPIPIIMLCAGPIRQGCSGKMIPMPNTMTRWTIRRRAY